MEIKELLGKIKEALVKYKYAVIILLIGLFLLLLPEKKTEPNQQANNSLPSTHNLSAESLSEVLQLVEGAGRVRVLFSVASGEETLYQTNQDTSSSEDNKNTKTETVIIVDADRKESGLIKQVNPQKYLGAIVVCQGADSPSVRLDITQAVSRIIGLSADKICVLKMK